MTARYAHAFAALVRRDLQIFLSYKFAVFSMALSSIFSLTLFHFVSRLVHVQNFRSADDYYSFVVVRLVILQVLTSTLAFPSTTLRQELVAGTFERLLLSPFGGVAAILALLIFPLLRGIVLGIVTLGVATVLFGMHIAWSTAAFAIPVAALGALAFAPFGLLMLGVTLMVKQAVAGSNYIVAGFSLVAGLYFPISLLPGWVRWMSDVQPFTPAADLLRHLLVGTRLSHSVWSEVLRIAAFAIVLLPPMILFVDRALRFARRRGTLIEY